MADAQALSNGPGQEDVGQAIVELVPMVRKVVAARIKDPQTVEDLVQETLARVMAARERVEVDTLAPYAAVTARNLVASYVERNDRSRERAHLLADVETSGAPVDELLREEERAVVARALTHLSAEDRDVLLAHEVQGQDTKSMAATRGSTPGAVAAHLGRARARLRVEYLLALGQVDPPSDRCRAVLRAISLGDRRRQRELDTSGHLLHCDCCGELAPSLLRHGTVPSTDESIRVAVTKDANVVTARQKGREAAAHAGFTPTDQTVIATAISEIARNIVKFAKHGEITITPVAANGRRGINIVARDAGPGIPDLDQAMQDGFSTYRGLGLGLPGARRLMDSLEVVSVPGEGTTVTMEKWL